MDKLEHLQKIIGKYSSAVVAFSGGVDSTFLAWACKSVLGDKVLLVTAQSSTYPASELDGAKRSAALLDIKQRIIISEEMDIPGFADNSPGRCYYCKKELFTKIVTIARDEKFEIVFDGSNMDDMKDFRPGRKALAELNIRSPMVEAELTKDEIRSLSEKAGLPTAAKPSFACLASRFPYGEKITIQKLDRVESPSAPCAPWGSRNSGCGATAISRGSSSSKARLKKAGKRENRLRRRAGARASPMSQSMQGDTGLVQ